MNKICYNLKFYDLKKLLILYFLVSFEIHNETYYKKSVNMPTVKKKKPSLSSDYKLTINS